MTRKTEPARGERPWIPLDTLTEWFSAEVPALEQRHVDRELLRAQIADHYRDLGIEPVDPATFEELTQDLVPEAWRRLALIASALRLEELRELVPRILDGDPRAQLERGFVELARSSDLLTMEALRASAQRIEELSRRLAQMFDVAIAGETPEEARARLEQLDYRRLLNEAERARARARDTTRGPAR